MGVETLRGRRQVRAVFVMAIVCYPDEHDCCPGPSEPTEAAGVPSSGDRGSSFALVRDRGGYGRAGADPAVCAGVADDGSASAPHMRHHMMMGHVGLLIGGGAGRRHVAAVLVMVMMLVMMIVMAAAMAGTAAIVAAIRAARR